MDKVRPSTFENITTSSDGHEGLVYTAGGRMSPRLVTANAFKVCKENLTSTTTVLERHLQDINNRLQKLSSEPSGTSDKHQAEKERLEEEKGSIKQCLAICADASDQANEDRTNFFEDVTMANDGHQVVVSTFGDLVSAKRITVGDRSIQWLGQMSDETLQRLSRDRSSATTDKKLRGEGVTPFEDRYGSGVKLSSKSIEGDTSPQ
jgi:hypothetical protein